MKSISAVCLFGYVWESCAMPGVGRHISGRWLEERKNIVEEPRT